MKAEWWLCWGFLFAVTVGCGGLSATEGDRNGDGTDSNTHWLRNCVDDGDCEEGLICLCGACSATCEGAASCDDLEGGVCVEARCGASDDETTLLCSRGCDRDADCPGDTRCESDVCVPGDATSVNVHDDPDPEECVAAIDTSVCCLEFVAITREELEADSCLIEVADVDPSVVQECAPPCPAECVPLEQRSELGSTAARNDDGSCELVTVCAGGTCSGDRCDPREGCGTEFVCAAYGCEQEGVCVPELPVDCPETDDPVCSCDGSEFRNACLAGPRGIDPACSLSPPTYDPCANATCGDGCRQCAPDDVDCAETEEPKYCTADGRCIDTDPECPAPVGDACPAQDAMSSGDDCLTLEGYAFDGAGCVPVICGCVGEDCDAIFASQGFCETAFSACIEPPTCTDEVFPLVEDSTPRSPAYPEFSFEVVIHPDLEGEAGESVAIFPDWTPAQWLGVQDLVSGTTECPGWGQEEPALCPYPREISLSVDGELVFMLAAVKWEQVQLPPIDANVDVRIENHPRGTSSFQVRDPETQLLLLVIVQSGEELELEDAWEFPPLTFRPGATVCEARVPDCNWRFLAQALHVEVQGVDQSSRIDPLEVGALPQAAVGAPVYQVSNSGLYFRTPSETECSVVFPARQSFAVSKVGD